ncbi:D-lyxose ketol-isomerase [bacterium BMS3Abin05]|nr:D-lyxose ketol-isomerase [bacterium BMS3Abin05]
MKRSGINEAIRKASACFKKKGWHLPPESRWDVTDFGLGDFRKYGLVLMNLTDEKEYCEKLMYGLKDQRTPAHCHRRKKEDIIARSGVLIVQVWNKNPDEISDPEEFRVKVNGKIRRVKPGDRIRLHSGERITLAPGIYHEFYSESDDCIIGEISSGNDDLHDNFFVNPDIGRFPNIEEDEPPIAKLLSE